MTSTFYLLSIFHKESESLLSCVSLIISSHSDQSRSSCSVQCGHPSPVLWKRMLLWDLCPRALSILTPLRVTNILLLIWCLAASYPLTWLVLFHSFDAYIQLSGVVDRCGQREWRNASRTGQIAAPSSYKTIRLITQPMACEEFCSKSLSETFFKDTSHFQQLSVGLVIREGLGINIAQGGNLVLSNSQVYEKTQTWLERGNWYSARRDELRCFWYHILCFSWPPCFFPFWEEVIAVPAYEDLLFTRWPSAVLCGQLAKVSLCYLSHFLAPSKQIKSWTYEKEQKKGVMIRCFLTPGYNSLTGLIKISKLTCL